jgi:HSP20 family protein
MSKKMKRTDQGKVAPEIWMRIDLSNSLNGGSSHIETHIQPSDVGYEGFIRVPGVDIDEISVEVIQNRVIVYHLFPVFDQQSEGAKLYTRVLANFKIPADGDYEGVSATYLEEKKCLKVLIPYNQKQKGYRNTIYIER